MSDHTEDLDHDVYVASNYPDTNYNDDAFVKIRYDGSGSKGDPIIQEHTLLDVDFSEAADITVENVDSAFLVMFLSSAVIPPGSVFKIRFSRCTAGWDEDTVTYNTKPGYDVAIYSADWIVAGPTGWKQFDIWTAGAASSLVKDAIANRSKVLNMYGLHSAAVGTADNECGFYSREKPGDEPYIVINYTVEGVPKMWMGQVGP